MTTLKRILADSKSPIIEAVIQQLYLFKTLDDAHDKLRFIEKRFVQSTHVPPETNNKLIFWIRGYELTQEEQDSGHSGNFALIYILPLEDERFTLAASKIITDNDVHPERKRKKAKHPDSGYWLMRQIKKNWRYETIEEAYADLLCMAEDFPEVSIPARGKIYTILYRKSKDDSSSLHKVVLEVEATPEGHFVISCKPNTYTKPKKSSSASSPESAQTKGRFTSMVELNRKKRSNINDQES